ncbi:phosphoglycerol transferase [Clostridium zeae]|uniref:Phosphoglycerol transferase n=1 Tax=Clostridium zeae TaxID=2759022 RepID=A0ABQ1E997_9CLOT|nr:LTA synthase family protein [Clostridium zeae]GFZ31372.1 phosphoglycerol transferase [Clostridium zeae]
MNINKLNISSIKKLFNGLTKDKIIRVIFYILILYSISIKGAFFLGFAENKDPYSFNFLTGYNKAHPFFNYYLTFTAAFLSFGFLFKGVGKYVYMLVINIFLTLLMIVDLFYFRGFLTVPSILVTTQTANLDNMSGTIFSLVSRYDVVFLIDFIILAVYLFFASKYFKKIKRSVKSFAIVFVLSVIYIGYIPFNLYVLHREVSGSYIFSGYDPMDSARYFSPVGYHVLDIYNVYKDSKPYTLTASENKQIDDYFNNKKENLPDNKYKNMFANKNLLVIQVESLENFVINQKIDGQEITPSLNKLINNSIYFPNTFEQVNEGTSSDSDLMVNTSMLPLRSGSTFFKYPNTTYYSLPKLLEEMGYDTAAIHADKGSFWNYAAGLKGIGFKKFFDYYSYEDDEQIGLGLSDGTYLRQVVPKIKSLKQPFYSFVVTLTSHGPFDLPEKYKELNIKGELKDNIMGSYFQSVHYTDKQIGIFLDNLDKEGLLDNTVVVVVGDHTGVHKYYDDKVNTLKNPEPWYLDNGNHTVPFIIYQKNFKEPVKLDTYGGQIDIMPTLAYVLGIDEKKYINSALGRNLLNTDKSFAILTNKTFKSTGNATDKDKEQATKALEISDKMIKSNYFKNK